MSKNDKNWKNRTHFNEVEFDGEAFKEGKNIPVAKVTQGMEIVTAWDRNGNILKTFSVKERVPCPGGNGMFVHINKSNCYDSRQMVWVR